MRHFMRLRAGKALLFLVVALLPAIPANAQLQFTLTQPLQYGQAGQTLAFGGTLTNTGAVELFLNGDDFTLSSPDLELDDTLFLESLPLSLSPGANVTAELFHITVASNTPLGVYSGLFTIIGGTTDGSTIPLASQSFQVTLAAPEPGTVFLLGAGILTAGLLRPRRRPRLALSATL